MRNSGVPVADFIYVKKGGKINIVQTMIEKGWEKGFIKAAEGCTYMGHTASPFPLDAVKDEQILIKPAVEGTLAAMKAA